MTLAEAQSVFAVADSRALAVMEAMWTRFLPHMVRLRQLVSSGALGEVRSLQADTSQALSPDPAHRLNNPALGGGALLDLGVYAISFAVDVLGTPDEVQAVAHKGPTGVDVRTSLLLAFPNGAQAVLHAGIDAAGPCTATIIGSRARVEINGAWHRPTGFTVIDTAGNVLERFDQHIAHRGMQYEAAAFEKLIATGTTDDTTMPRRDTLTTLEILQQAQELLQTSGPTQARI